MSLTVKNKLTLWLGRDVIAVGKAEAKRQHKSLSQLFMEFIQDLRRSSQKQEEISPRVKRLKGSLKGKALGREDYHFYLESKYLKRG